MNIIQPQVSAINLMATAPVTFSPGARQIKKKGDVEGGRRGFGKIARASQLWSCYNVFLSEGHWLMIYRDLQGIFRASGDGLQMPLQEI